jgi:hypothetical protein
VRFFAQGITAPADTVSVQLRHLGDETVVDTNDIPHRFLHEPITLNFQYRVADMSCSGPGTVDGVIGNRPGKDQFAPVGPFATWLVEINPAYNKGVNLEGVTDAWFEFAGTFQS